VIHDWAKEAHERLLGDEFVGWYNQRERMSFGFERRGDDPPDLIYRAGSQQLFLEITEAYPDSRFAARFWSIIRPRRKATRFASTRDPHGGLVRGINDALQKKGQMRLPRGCILVVFLNHPLPREELDGLLPSIVVSRYGNGSVYLGGWSMDELWWYQLTAPVDPHTA